MLESVAIFLLEMVGHQREA